MIRSRKFDYILFWVPTPANPSPRVRMLWKIIGAKKSCHHQRLWSYHMQFECVFMKWMRVWFVAATTNQLNALCGPLTNRLIRIMRANIREHASVAEFCSHQMENVWCVACLFVTQHVLRKVCCCLCERISTKRQKAPLNPHTTNKNWLSPFPQTFGSIECNNPF